MKNIGRRGLLSVLLLLAGMFASAGAENWPQFRGPNRDGISGETGLYRSWPESGPKVVWSVKMAPGYSGPAIYDGRVYVNDYDEVKNEWLVRCLSLETGEELWRYSDPKLIRPNHLITRTVPAVDDRYVFSLDPKCVFHCLEAKTGKELWRKDLPKEYHTRIPPWYTGQCPLIEPDRVLIATGGDAVAVALDKATGKELWRTPNPQRLQMSHASLMPAELGGVKQYLYATLKGILGVAADDGRLLWFHPFRFNLAVAPSPLPIDGDRVFQTSLYNADSVMLQVTRDGGQFHTKELFRLPPSVWNSEIHTPILWKDHMFAVGKKSRGLFTCVDLNGKIVWDSRGRAFFGLGSFLLADGMFFVLEGDTGTLRLLEANTEGYRELAHAPVLSGHDVWAPMALSNGRLVLRDTMKMVCIEVGPPAGNNSE